MGEKLRVFGDSGIALKIPLAGITYPDAKYYIERRNSAITVIEYVLDGEGLIKIDGNFVPVRRGQVYLLCAGTDQEYFANRENPYKKIFINATGSLAYNLPAELGLKKQGIYDGKKLKQLFKTVADIVNLKISTEDEVALSALFCEALIRLSKQKITDENNDAYKMKNYIDTNIFRIVKNGELSAEIYRSKDYCIKCFFSEFGTTPYEYQLQIKMKTAKSMLKNTSLPVSEVGAQLGYGDPQYFSGLFKKKCGVSPKAYRNKYRK